MKLAGNWKQYRDAVAESFSRSMHNPSVHWKPQQGFFATPDSNLVPMDVDEIEIDTASFDGEGGASMTGSRREYADVRIAIRLVLSGVEENFGRALSRIICARDSERESSAYRPISAYRPMAELRQELATAEAK